MYLIYIIRRDLRLSDNVILHALQHHPRFTHLLPLYIFPPSQVEVSDFLKQGEHSPYPEARSQIGKFWRCGPHRARFLAEGLWDFKTNLEKLGSGLIMRVGHMDEVMSALLNDQDEEFSGRIGGVWMTKDWASEELQQERDVRDVIQRLGHGRIKWKVWDGEEMLIHNDDLPMKPADLPHVFTSFRKAVEPLRQSVRPPLPPPISLPPLPPSIPFQRDPFMIPSSFEDLCEALQKPLTSDLTPAIEMPVGAKSAHPFKGGETQAHSRIQHLLSSGAMSSYKDTRNGLLGRDFSTKLSAYLAHGFISARQIHGWMSEFEDGEYNSDMGLLENTAGYGSGENKGTSAVRFELLWRDYMRLCMRKYGNDVFSLYGYRGKQTRRTTDSDHLTKKSTGQEPIWKSLASAHTEFRRFQNGTTGTGLIDASMRELYLTGYTSNRARQNCASFLSKWLDIDWRLGAEWYESMLVDYDVANNWGNWQYVAGVGNDPRENNGRKGGQKAGRRFNPVKQGYDYDPRGEYIRTWVAELHNIDDSASSMEVLMSPWKVKEKLARGAGQSGGVAQGAPQETMEKLACIKWVTNPLVRITYKSRRSM
ncbi:hypothetical protein E4T56_gene13451 [Termitomyces sp. T112]|nr:hypothetical protein E4T56_gene13451 [Termitomyces sp. T112]